MKVKKFLELINGQCYASNCYVGKCPFAEKLKCGEVGCLIDLTLLSEGEPLNIDKIIKNVKKFKKRRRNK